VDGDEAVELFLERERALAAFRVRDRELTEAQRPAQLPKVGLPREAHEAERATVTLASTCAKFGVDLRSSIFDRRNAIDPVAIALRDARNAELSTAGFWVAYEERVLADHGDVARRHRRTAESDREHLLDKEAVENLRELFGLRWQEFERVQGMSELERFRLRESR
jgi:hypothetical protein